MLAKFTNQLKFTWVLIGLLVITNISVFILLVNYRSHTNKDIDYYFQILSKSQDRDHDAASGFFVDDGSSDHAQRMVDYYNNRYQYLSAYNNYIDICSQAVRSDMVSRYPKKSIADATIFVDDLSEGQIMDSYYSKDLLKNVKNKSVYDYVLKLKSLSLLYNNVSRLSVETIEQKRVWSHEYNLRSYNQKYK